jgi:hypothetical protein
MLCHEKGKIKLAIEYMHEDNLTRSSEMNKMRHSESSARNTAMMAGTDRALNNM